MPFTYKRKHEKYGTTSAGQMRSAIQAVLEGDSERKTAKRLGIPRGEPTFRGTCVTECL